MARRRNTKAAKNPTKLVYFNQETLDYIKSTRREAAAAAVRCRQQQQEAAAVTVTVSIAAPAKTPKAATPLAPKATTFTEVEAVAHGITADLLFPAPCPALDVSYTPSSKPMMHNPAVVIEAEATAHGITADLLLPNPSVGLPVYASVIKAYSRPLFTEADAFKYGISSDLLLQTPSSTALPVFDIPFKTLLKPLYTEAKAHAQGIPVDLLLPGPYAFLDIGLSGATKTLLLPKRLYAEAQACAQGVSIDMLLPTPSASFPIGPGPIKPAADVIVTVAQKIAIATCCDAPLLSITDDNASAPPSPRRLLSNTAAVATPTMEDALPSEPSAAVPIAALPIAVAAAAAAAKEPAAPAAPDAIIVFIEVGGEPVMAGAEATAAFAAVEKGDKEKLFKKGKVPKALKALGREAKALKAAVKGAWKDLVSSCKEAFQGCPKAPAVLY